MVNFEKFTLGNGLRVIVHSDYSTPIVTMNVLYDVGSRDEQPDKTGFAHLFEHLMFGGSVNIPRYDEPLEKAGGENNAFTSNDITSYYLSIPKSNLEIAFWLESDRMLDLDFSRKSLNVQRNVVIEEFHQTHLNQPYGDVWQLLRSQAYTTHPYRWETIGAHIDHIANAKMSDVRSFYKKFYHPANAILTLAGPVSTAEIVALCQKWFEPIPAGKSFERKLPAEPRQEAARFEEIFRPVPQNAIYKAWHMGGRLDDSYHAADILTDILSAGESSRLFLELVKNQRKFSAINAFITGSLDPGLLIITGKLMQGVTPDEADKAIVLEIDRLTQELISDYELEKAKNTVESMAVLSEVKPLERALNLSYFELLGDAGLTNTEIDKYRCLSSTDLREAAQKIFTPENVSTLYYRTQY